jgi:hypothetical protein
LRRIHDALLDRLVTKLRTAIERLDPDAARWSDVMNAQRLLSQNVRQLERALPGGELARRTADVPVETPATATPVPAADPAEPLRSIRLHRTGTE